MSHRQPRPLGTRTHHRLGQLLGYQFADTALLELALTCPRASEENNDYLEFLGDGALGYYLRLLIDERYGAVGAGEATRRFSLVARNTTLAHLTLQLGLLPYIDFGYQKQPIAPKVLADVFEAVFAAMDADLRTRGDAPGLSMRHELMSFCRRVFSPELEFIRFERPDEMLVDRTERRKAKVIFEIKRHRRAARGQPTFRVWMSLVRINKAGVCPPGEGIELDSANNRACAMALLKLYPDEFPCRDAHLSRILGLPLPPPPVV